ncbi:MAG: hypothetical protein MUE85_08380 [Microscillaceae bacterium]|jgi:hypothetical protein|nr:hypothetical protein [Microscillaceae bacterium]
MIKSNFREWTLDKIDEILGLRQVKQLAALTHLLAYKYEPNDFEKQYLIQLQELYALGGDDWNEVELENKFISPLIILSRIDNERFSYFLERELATTIGEFELSGKVDGMIASGFRSPKKPFFCLKEYKRQTDPDGDPRGQCLIAMLVAQHLNQNNQPVYGCYVIGRSWYFMVLQNQEYAISNIYACTNDEIFDIFRIIKGIKSLIEKQLSETA